jgi:putative transposase
MRGCPTLRGWKGGVLRPKPKGLRRYYGQGHLHFLTFSCHRRLPLLGTVRARNLFVKTLGEVRARYGFLPVGYVVMPEHVHLLISEPPRKTLADALKSLKQGVSRRLIGEAEHFWQKRYYDFNIRNREQFVEKLRYIHRNPVQRGLCERAEEWEWSSFLQYATGCEGRVEIECE